MKQMDLFNKNEKTNREKRINSLLDNVEICKYCILEDSLCDCEHCDEAYDKYLETNDKTEEEDLKDSGFIDEEEIEELDDLDRLDKFENGELLRINIWFPEGKVKPIECLDKLRIETKLATIPIRVSEKAPWHWSFILEDAKGLTEEDLLEIKGIIEERLTKLSKDDTIKLSRVIVGNCESDYI